MDVDNVTDQYWDLLQNQKKTLEKAKKRQGQRPHDWKPREQTYFQFMGALLARQRLSGSDQKPMLHSSFIPPAYLPCTAPLAELQRIAIRDLQLETHHRGTYLLLRAITPPSRMTGVMVLVEDERADVIMLQLYQQEEEKVREAADVVNVNTILLVKEPYFKVMASGEYGLRVDHLSDVIYVGRDDPRIPKAWRSSLLTADRSAESLRLKGNSAVGKGNYWQAITEYSDALSQPATIDEIEMIKRNRALAFLKTKQFDAALSDTGFPHFGSNPNEKALFRAVEALYSLGRFRECCEVLELLCTNFPNNNQASVVLDRARDRCLEQDIGEYDFKLLQSEARKRRPPLLNHATYIGPVEIKATENKGRGLFTTTAVKAGDLLLCEKAFSYAYVAESEGDSSEHTLLLNLETNRGFMGGQADLLRTIVQKLYCNPSVARTFTTLYHGTYDAVSMSTVDGKPIVDTFLAERIMSLNVFGCPLSSLTSHKDIMANKSEKPAEYHSCGIWTQASYINHSCMSNARRSFIGDMMIVRATQDLEAGTEITFWYHMPDATNLNEMQKNLKPWGFVCDCTICQDAKDTRAAVSSKREDLLGKMKSVCGSSASHGIQTDRMERLLRALDDTYTRPADEVPRLALWDPQLLLARSYVAQNNMVSALKSVGKVLTALGFVVVGTDSSSTRFRVVKWGLVVDHLVEAFLHAQAAFMALGAWDDMKSAGEYAKVVYRIVVGEDTSFGSTYGG
ncbi:hypothetical protein CC80DRAFT_467564 [Byssothecium circinans]|uniref:SET domain-containing protein n=1 Tax=Byssothecium circinans TaxID=147558 RepID=A0A6A5U2P5_9PLEO|nr:hypothetical protein CC80DRAFT_467564 [Byssothecium circinans]